MPTLSSVFSDIANAIRAKAGTVLTYKPTEMATAINNIPTGNSTPHLELKYSGAPLDYTDYVFTESGIYAVVLAWSAYGGASAVFEDATTIIEQTLELGEGRGGKLYIVRPALNSKVTLKTEYSSTWSGRMAEVIKINDFNSFTYVIKQGQGDGSIQYTFPLSSDDYMIFGICVGDVGSSDHANVRDFTTNMFSAEYLHEESVTARLLSIYISKGELSPSFKFYGYEGGFAGYFVIKVS